MATNERIGVYPGDVPEFINYCQALPSLQVCGLMSHFPCADEADKRGSLEGLCKFRLRAVVADDLW